MPDKDDDLLARLNALKPSSVKLGNGSNAPALDVEIQEPISVEDKLADRLKGLRMGTSKQTASFPVGRETAESLISRTKDAVAAEPDPIRDWQRQSDDDEPDLDALLAELGPDDQWKLDPDGPKNINSLLNEAKDALPKEGDEQHWDADEPAKTKPSRSEVDAGFDEAEEGDGREKDADQRDQVEADDYVTRVLAELEFDRKHGIANEPPDDGDEGEKQEASTLDFPSTPSNLPQPLAANTSDEPPSYEDSELASRFSNLGLNLPSTPSGPPSARIKSSVNAKLAQAKKKTDLPVYTDEDIDSWCCICNDDGTVRCLGCDGDVYCSSCWNDGHGTGPGQERDHKAVQYGGKGGEGGLGKKRLAAA